MMLLSLAASAADATTLTISAPLSVSDKIQLAGSILSTAASIVAIIISVITLRQNNKMLEATSRPVVSIYFDYTQMGEPTGYFVVKNFGNSPALIDSLHFNDPIRNHPTHLADISAIFRGLIGNSIAPGQKFLVPFKLYEYSGGKAIFDICYHSQTKSYSEHFEIDVERYGKLVKPRVSSNLEKATSYATQEIAERLM